MTIYQGVNGVNRKMKQLFQGVEGVNREVKERWEGVEGVNRKVFSSNKTINTTFKTKEPDWIEVGKTSMQYGNGLYVSDSAYPSPILVENKNIPMVGDDGSYLEGLFATGGWRMQYVRIPLNCTYTNWQLEMQDYIYDGYGSNRLGGTFLLLIDSNNIVQYSYVRNDAWAGYSNQKYNTAVRSGMAGVKSGETNSLNNVTLTWKIENINGVLRMYKNGDVVSTMTGYPTLSISCIELGFMYYNSYPQLDGKFNYLNFNSI